jgi:hypothetical protein
MMLAACMMSCCIIILVCYGAMALTRVHLSGLTDDMVGTLIPLKFLEVDQVCTRFEYSGTCEVGCRQETGGRYSMHVPCSPHSACIMPCSIRSFPFVFVKIFLYIRIIISPPSIVV